MSEKLKNGWIDIDEQLPQPEQVVLVILRKNSVQVTCTFSSSTFHGQSMFYLNGVMGIAYFAEDIRYWQPAPSKEVR